MLNDKIKMLRAGCDPHSNIDYYGMVCFRGGLAMSSDGTNTIIAETGLRDIDCCVDADKLHRICKAFKTEPKITKDDKHLLLEVEAALFELPFKDHSIFPRLDKFRIENTYHSGKGITSAVRRAMFAAEERIEQNPICGVQFSNHNVMSTNGKEVMCVQLKEPFKSDFRISYSAAKLISKQNEDPSKVFTIGDTLGFVFSDIILMTRALHGDFPKSIVLGAVARLEEAHDLPENTEQAMRAFNSVASNKEFYVTLVFPGGDGIAFLDGDIPASYPLTSNFTSDHGQVSVRGDRLMYACKALSPTHFAIQDNFLQLVSEDSVYCLGKVS